MKGPVGSANHLVVIPITIEEWNEFKSQQQEILKRLDKINTGNTPKSKATSDYITAIEFMKAVKISRSHFDNLIAKNKINTIKKFRRIYVLASEVERYFLDPSIQ